MDTQTLFIKAKSENNPNIHLQEIELSLWGVALNITQCKETWVLCVLLFQVPQAQERKSIHLEHTVAIPIWVSCVNLTQSQPAVYRWMKWWPQLTALVIECKYDATHRSRMALWPIFCVSPFFPSVAFSSPDLGLGLLNFQKWEGRWESGSCV